MRRSTLSTAALTFACLILLAGETKAQGVSGYTSIDYYQDNNTVDAYSETDLDIDLTCDYDARVSMSVYDQNWNRVNNQIYTDEDTTGFGWAAVDMQFTPNSGYTYTAFGDHTAVAALSDYYDFSPYLPFWYDDYYLSFFESQGISEPYYYYFLSPGLLPVERNNPDIDVGSTYDAASITFDTPTVEFVRATIGSVSVGFNALNNATIDATRTGVPICGEANLGREFTLTVDFEPPQDAAEIEDPPVSYAKRFGSTADADFDVSSTDIDNVDLNSRPRRGQMVIGAYSRTSGSTNPPYNAIKVHVAGKFGNGQAFKNDASVHITCP